MDQGRNNVLTKEMQSRHPEGHYFLEGRSEPELVRKPSELESLAEGE